MSEYQPPLKLTEQMLTLTGEICELAGRIAVSHSERLTPHLRRSNRIHTIHSSLAIEHNMLTIDQVTDMRRTSAKTKPGKSTLWPCGVTSESMCRYVVTCPRSRTEKWPIWS